MIVVPVVDLFCGCGGMSKGFEQAGFEIAAAYDYWKEAVLCYNANFLHDSAILDLSDVEPAIATIREFHPDLIIGGTPCQDFSAAGRRKEGHLATLTYDYARIVTQVHPNYFVMENVPRARISNAYDRARQLYLQNGYSLTEVVLDASRCGVPQKRHRFFCIGALNAQNDFLLDSIFDACDDNELSIQEYFRRNEIPLEFDAFYRHPRTYRRRAIFSITEASPTIRGINRPKPRNYKHHPNDAVSEDEIANVRALTLLERSYIQTFPQNYHFMDLNISTSDLEQMIGNAVPVSLAQFIGERLREYINRRNALMNQDVSFAAWLRNEKKYVSDRSISDVFSRLKRVRRFLPDQELNRYTIMNLEENKEYQHLSTSVKSQIRRAVHMRLEYLDAINHNG